MIIHDDAFRMTLCDNRFITDNITTIYFNDSRVGKIQESKLLEIRSRKRSVDSGTRRALWFYAIDLCLQKDRTADSVINWPATPTTVVKVIGADLTAAPGKVYRANLYQG